MKTLITGAGASMDVCKAFKNGETLLNDIYKLISLNEEFRSQLQKDGYSLDVLNLFCDELNSFREYGHRKSIDEFIGELMTFPEYESLKREHLIEIGKYCIIYSILIMEDAFLKSYNELNHKENWIDIFKKEFEGNGNYKIITFNYDRLLEHLIFKSDSQTINHVYGTIRLKHWDFGRIPKSIKDFEKPDGKTHLGDFLIVNDRVKYPKSSGQIGFDHVAGQLQKWNGVIGFGFDFFNIRNHYCPTKIVKK